MSLPSNVILIGFMGSGKSSTGRELAGLMGFELKDLDDEIEKNSGKRVQEIFATEGEASFRDLERKEIRSLGSLSRTVICPGGGAWMDPKNREELLKNGWCVWLRVSPEEAWRRIRSDVQTRPLVDISKDPLAEIQRLINERTPFYSLAHQAVETDGLKPKEVAIGILGFLKKSKPFSFSS